MADTQKILHHIAELYAKPRANQDFETAVFEMEEKMSARFDEYDKAFGEKITADVIKAIDDYWRFKNDKTRPTLAQLMAMENSDVSKKEECDPESDEGYKHRIIKCMKEIYFKHGMELAQKYWSNFPAYKIPYPTEQNIEEL